MFSASTVKIPQTQTQLQAWELENEQTESLPGLTFGSPLEKWFAKRIAREPLGEFKDAPLPPSPLSPPSPIRRKAMQMCTHQETVVHALRTRSDKKTRTKKEKQRQAQTATANTLSEAEAETAKVKAAGAKEDEHQASLGSSGELLKKVLAAKDCPRGFDRAQEERTTATIGTCCYFGIFACDCSSVLAAFQLIKKNDDQTAVSPQRS